MIVKIQGTKEQCVHGIAKLRNSVEVIKVSDFQSIKPNSQLGYVYVEVKD